MNNLDKQLIYAINEWLLNLTDGGFQLSKYSMGDDDTTWNAFEEIKKVTLEANKQSILKAIMERIEKVEDKLGVCDLDGVMLLPSKEVKSVIKEVLQTKTNETN